MSGSHKARHLFGVLLWLEVAERLGLSDPVAHVPSSRSRAVGTPPWRPPSSRRPAAGTLRVFVPVDAEPAVLARLEELGARITVCPRAGDEPGDPTVTRLLQALADGALPFTCQGNLNGLAVEGA